MEACGRRPVEGLGAVVRGFEPNWFAVTMGTGVVALILPQMPWPLPGAEALGRSLWLVTSGLFVLFGGLYAARWLIFPGEARQIFAHPVASLFLGTIPMGLATVTNGWLIYGYPLWGDPAITVATILWGIDVALALACGLGVPYLMMTRQTHRIESMTAMWLLPVVAAEVAAASGGLLAPALAPEAGTMVVIASYVLWAFSVPLALSLLVLLLLRLVVHKLPDHAQTPTGWLALGPIGTGSLGLVVLGNAATVICQDTQPLIAMTASGLGLLGGLMLWGYGLWWLLLALTQTTRSLRAGLPFSMGWWAFTFPLGVYSLATLALARSTDLPLFWLAGEGLSLGLLLAWLVVASRTAWTLKRP